MAPDNKSCTRRRKLRPRTRVALDNKDPKVTNRKRKHMGDAAQARPQFIHITNNGAVNNLRELVRTHVILAPGACGMEGQSAG